MNIITSLSVFLFSLKTSSGQPAFPPYTQQCGDDAGPPFVDDPPGRLYHDGSSATPVLKNGECATPLQDACTSRGSAKTAYLEGPVQCNGNGWYCRILVDENWPPENLLTDLNFVYCNQTDSVDIGHCHGSNDDSTYYWWLRDHWFRGYNGRLRCCCNWDSGTDPLTDGRIVDRCDFRRLVTPTENIDECRDANEDHNQSFEGGCEQIVDEIQENDDQCWEVNRFGFGEEDDEEDEEEEEENSEDDEEEEENSEDEDDEEEEEEEENSEDEDDEEEEEEENSEDEDEEEEEENSQDDSEEDEDDEEEDPNDSPRGKYSVEKSQIFLLNDFVFHLLCTH